MARLTAHAKKAKSSKAKPSLQKPKQQAKANNLVEIPATIECTICKELKDKENYSRNQLTKKTHKCMACVSDMNKKQQTQPKKADRKRKPEVVTPRVFEKKQKKHCLLTTAEIVQKQKDMRKAALEELEKVEIKDPALKVDDSTPIPSEEVVANFYKIFEEVLEERDGWYEGPLLKKIINEYPPILNMKHNGQILTEWLCDQEVSAYRRDVLYDVIGLGAKVTPKCYKSIVYLEEFLFEFECLILTGILELEGCWGKKTLDRLAETCQYEEGSYDDPSLINLFFGRAKSGDRYGFGIICNIDVEKTLKNLPILEEGVTHEKDGPFAKILTRYLEDFPLDCPETVEKWRKEQKEFFAKLGKK